MIEENAGVKTIMNDPKSVPDNGEGAHPIEVWLVEDNETFRRTVARALARVPTIHCSQRFPNAEEAIEALEGGAAPNVLLLDIELPGVNGVEAVRHIRSLSPSTRIIMFTVVDSHDKIFNAISAGASGYLLKTTSTQKMVEAIREVHTGGAPMTPQVARSVLDMFARIRPSNQDYGLTDREQKILQLMVDGMIKKEIADKLSISYHTVDTHLRNIYTKLHVHTRGGAVAKAVKERLF